MGSTVCAEVMSSLRVSNRNVQTQLLCVITAIATHCPYLLLCCKAARTFQESLSGERGLS